MSQILKTEALILHGIRWSETSKIVHLFTGKKGLIKAIARGAMRPKSPFRGTIENLNHIEVILAIKETRGLQIISQAALINVFSNIRENLEATAVAFSIAELLRELIHYNEDAQALFNYTIEIFSLLNQTKTRHDIIFLYDFILFLSEYLGFGWNFTECRSCKKIPDKFPIKADAINASIYCHNCALKVSQKTFDLQRAQWKLLSQIQQTPPKNLLSFLQIIPADLNYHPLLDLLLSHLNYHTEQTLQLKSLKMYLL